MSTDTKRDTHKLSAKGEILGRFAVKIAGLLRGRHKLGFRYHIDMGDFVIVTDPDQIIVTGNKTENKKYYRHSLYPGGLTEQSLAQKLASKPEEIITLAVRNMLPKNRLRREWLKRLKFERTNVN